MQLTTICWILRSGCEGSAEVIVVAVAAVGVAVDPLFLHRWRRLTLTLFLAIADSPSRRETSAFTSILSVPGRTKRLTCVDRRGSLGCASPVVSCHTALSSLN